MKKTIKILLSVILIIPFYVYANTIINGNDFEIYNRSKVDIYNKWTLGMIDPTVQIWTSEASYQAPYKAAVTTDEYLAEVVENLNYYRYLVGVPEVLESTTNDVALQKAEVIQTLYVEERYGLTHYLYNDYTKPFDMEDSFWGHQDDECTKNKNCEGAYANHNIISYGKPEEPNFFFFDESIFDPIEPQAGHRLALLSADVVKEDYGIGEKTIYGRSTIDLSNYEKMTNEFAAYPSPGLFPKQDFANISDWDIFLNVNYFKRLNDTEMQNVTVTITDLESGKTYERSLSDHNLVFDYKNYGFFIDDNHSSYSYKMNILQPDKEYDEYYEGSYRVYVSNLMNKQGELVDLEYTVTFYDKMEATISNVVEAKPYVTKILYDGEFDEEFLNEAIDGTYIILELDNGNTYRYEPSGYTFSYIGSAGEGSVVYHAVPNTDNLPEYIVDGNEIIDNIFIELQCNTAELTYRMEYTDTLLRKELGSSATFHIDGIWFDFNGYGDYAWVFEKNGKYKIIEDSDKYTVSDDSYLTFDLTINDLTSDDMGNYYLLFELFDDDNRYYYISKPLILNINIPFETIEFDSESIDINVGDSQKLEFIFTPLDANSDVTWESSDDTVVSVDNYGNIVGKKTGSATITVTDGNISASIIINVEGMLGDLNQNNVIDLVDVIKLLKLYLGVENVSEKDMSLGDINGDGEIGLQDVIALLKLYLGVQ